jgi:Na+-driven multidrug efflux pump
MVSVAVFLAIALPGAIANAYFNWPTGVTWAALFVSMLIAGFFLEHRYILRSASRREAERVQEHRRVSGT